MGKQNIKFVRARGESKIKYREGKKRRKENEEYREGGPETDKGK